jgi:hypothetical protein
VRVGDDPTLFPDDEPGSTGASDLERHRRFGETPGDFDPAGVRQLLRERGRCDDGAQHEGRASSKSE